MAASSWSMVSSLVLLSTLESSNSAAINWASLVWKSKQRAGYSPVFQYWPRLRVELKVLPATLYPSSVLFTYHHFRKCLQRGFQLVCRRQGIWEVHGSRQKQQRGGDLLVEMQLQPLPESNTTLQRLLQICTQTYILRVSPLMPFLKSPDGQTSTLFLQWIMKNAPICLLLSLPGRVVLLVVLLWLPEISSLWHDTLPALRSHSGFPPPPLLSADKHREEVTQSQRPVSLHSPGCCRVLRHKTTGLFFLLTTEIRTLSSARMALSFMMSWKRRKLLVPIDWSSRRRQSATSWGRVRLSSVSSSSNSLENFMICSLLGRSPESRIYSNEKIRACKKFKWDQVYMQKMYCCSPVQRIIHEMNIVSESM